MIKRLFVGIIVVSVALVALPPLWFVVFPVSPVADLPPAGRRVVLPSGVGINVIEEGEGRPLLLVHGLPGSGYDWRGLVPELADRGFRVIAMDRSGYGRSDVNPDGDFSLQRNASDVVGVIRAMELEAVTLVGWSYGGATASLVAAERPPELARVVLIGTGGPDSDDALPPEADGLMRFLYSDPVLRWRTAVPPLGRGLIAVLSEQAYSGQPMPDWWIPGVVKNFERWDTLVTYRGEMFGLDGGDEDIYAQSAVPTLLLHGDDDRLAPIGISRYLVSRIPDATLVEFSGASHMLPVTHAGAVADAIAAFIGPESVAPDAVLSEADPSPAGHD